jgi:hypothetical protein
VNEPDFENMEQIREYVNLLAANVNRMILRERAQNTTIQYFAWMLDREGIEIDESCQRFIKVFGRVMNLESHLEHMEMDCEILNHALSSLKEECEIQNSISNSQSQDSQ